MAISTQNIVVKKTKATAKTTKATAKKTKAIAKKTKATVKKTKATAKKTKAVKKTKTTVVEPEVVDVAEPEVVDVAEPEVVDVAEPEVVDVEEPEVVDVAEPEVVDVEEPEVVDVEEPKTNVRKIIKLNQGDLTNLAIIIVNSIKHHDEVNSNILKKELKEIFTTSKQKTLTKTRIKLICKLCPTELHNNVIATIDAYIKVQQGKPKSLASNYNLFVADFCKQESNRSLEFKERSGLMSLKWGAMTVDEKQSYSLSEDIKLKHSMLLTNYRKKIKELKANQ